MTPFYNSPGFGETSTFDSDTSGTRTTRADRAACPVCGHPTGDCTGDGPGLDPNSVWGYNTNSSLDDLVTFYMEDDYFEEREIAPGIVTKILIHKKGKSISIVEARELGFLK